MLVLGLGPRVGTVPAAQVGESAQAEVQALFDSTRAALETGELAHARHLDGLAFGGGLRYRFGSYEARFDYIFRHFGVLGTVDVFSLGFALR